jgi:hypothetical protein
MDWQDRRMNEWGQQNNNYLDPTVMTTGPKVDDPYTNPELVIRVSSPPGWKPNRQHHTIPSNLQPLQDFLFGAWPQGNIGLPSFHPTNGWNVKCME